MWAYCLRLSSKLRLQLSVTEAAAWHTDFFYFRCLRWLSKPVLLHVRSHLSHRAPLPCIQGQEFGKHLHGLWGELPPQGREILLRVRPLLHPVPFCEVLEEVVGVHAALPGEVAGQDAEDDHPEGPRVQTGLHAERRSCHLLLAVQKGHGAQLWGHVGQGARDETDQGASLLSQAKVCQLDLAAVIVQQEDVFGLDVAVHQAVAVDELQSAGDLGDAAFHWRLWDAHLEWSDKEGMIFLLFFPNVPESKVIAFKN